MMNDEKFQALYYFTCVEFEYSKDIKATSTFQYPPKLPAKSNAA